MAELSDLMGWGVVLILFTSFIKIATVLSILRVGLGLTGVGFGIITLALALGLSLVVMEPQLEAVGGSRVLLSPQSPSTRQVIESRMLPFLERHSDPAILERFSRLANRSSAHAVDSNTERAPTEGVAPDQSGSVDRSTTVPRAGTLAAAFLVTELSEAFVLGAMLLIPFLIIDLLTAHVLTLLNVQQLAVATITVPLKLLLFVAVNGWALLSEKLIVGYL